MRASPQLIKLWSESEFEAHAQYSSLFPELECPDGVGKEKELGYLITEAETSKVGVTLIKNKRKAGSQVSIKGGRKAEGRNL